MKKIMTIFGAVLFASTILTSCATIFRGSNPHKSILITGTPEKANVIVDGKLIGQTPLNYEIKKRKKKFIQISKEGFEEYNTQVETKLNPGWTAVSIVGGAFPGLLIPTAIDFANGSVFNIKTDKIEYELKPTKKEVNNNPDKTNKIETSETNNFEQDDQIFNPRVRIRTGTREFLLGYKSCVTITTKNGIKIGSNIAEIEKDYLILEKNNTKIYYKDINKIRMFPIRRWYPIITSYTVLSPIFWFASSKIASTTSSDCKKQIKEIRVINKYSGFDYGKDRCK